MDKENKVDPTSCLVLLPKFIGFATHWLCMLDLDGISESALALSM